MEQGEIARIYEKDFRDSSLSVATEDPQNIFLQSFLPKNRDIEILDAGCGSGKYANMLYSLGYQNISALDILDKNLYNNLPFSYYQRDLQRSGFENERFDFIYSFSVIFYLESIEKGVGEIFRILRSGGILLLSAHTKYSFYTLERVLKSPKHLEGVKFYSAEYYKNLLKKSGFEILHVDGFNTSYLLYPFYRKVANRYKLNLPKIATKTTKNPFLAKIRSEISYHSIIVAKKI